MAQAADSEPVWPVASANDIVKRARKGELKALPQGKEGPRAKGRGPRRGIGI